MGLEGSEGHAQSGVRVDGPLGRRFLRGLSLTRLWCEGYGGAYELIEDASLYKTFTTGLRPWENHTTALAGEEMHPFWWLAPPPSPRRGDFILRYALVLFCPSDGGKSGAAG